VAFFGAHLALRGVARSRLGVLSFSAAGPLAALGLIRLFERASAPLVAYAVVPLAAVVCTLGAAAALVRLRPLRDGNRAASTRKWKADAGEDA
jgi:hypothetical protein